MVPPASVVLDTNIVSFLAKRDTRVRRFAHHLRGRRGLISFMTVAELRAWSIRHGWGRVRRDALESVLRQYTVVPSSEDVCNTWAALREEARRAGRELQHPDAWIAATAVVHGLPLVTHNVKDFDYLTGLTLLGPVP